MMGELEKLKSYLNNVELQLYEANEHISDLLEKVRSLEFISKQLLIFLLGRNKKWKLKTWNLNRKMPS